jgi:hypothetical protein
MIEPVVGSILLLSAQAIRTLFQQNSTESGQSILVEQLDLFGKVRVWRGGVLLTRPFHFTPMFTLCAVKYEKTSWVSKNIILMRRLFCDT